MAYKWFQIIYPLRFTSWLTFYLSKIYSEPFDNVYHKELLTVHKNNTIFIFILYVNVTKMLVKHTRIHHFE